MANGQNTSLVATAAAAYFTGGASLAAQGVAGSGGITGGGGAGTGATRGQGSTNASGAFSMGLESGNAGPSSADAMFGSPFSVFDGSGWNVSFGNESGIAAEMGAKSYTPTTTQSRTETYPTEEKSGGYLGGGMGVGGNSDILILGGLLLMAFIMMRE